MLGRSIQLFLEDGTPRGLRTAEVGGWSGVAIQCPRQELAKLRTRPEAKRAGVYLLIGPTGEELSRLTVYVGETDDVVARVNRHDLQKDFWTSILLFVYRSDNLTKAHVRWLEAALIREVRDAGRADITNVTTPQGGRLPEADVAEMEDFLEKVRLLLPTLGVNILATDGGVEGATAAEPVFELTWDEALATCIVRDDQFVVQRGSTARTVEVDSLSAGPRELRRNLQASGVLKRATSNRALLEFAKEYAFDSASMAAAVVAGTGLNGRAHWKVRGTQTTYAEWEAQNAE